MPRKSAQAPLNVPIKGAQKRRTSSRTTYTRLTTTIKSANAKPLKRIQKKSTSRGRQGKVLHVPVQTKDSQSVTLSIHKALTVPLQRSLSLLSAHRFPIDNMRLASQVARVWGMATVSIGALLLLFNIQAVYPSSLGPISTLINTIGGVSTQMAGYSYQECFTTGSTYYTTYECEQIRLTAFNETECFRTSSPYYGMLECENVRTATSYDPPPADFTFEGTSPFSGLVPINVYVTDAYRVNLYVQNKSANQVMTLGIAEQLSPGHWKFVWNTTSFPDGEYIIKANIVNSRTQTAYEQSDDISIFVKNTIVLQPTIQIAFAAASPFSGTVPVIVQVENATAVKLELRKSGSSTFTQIGAASRRSTSYTDWGYEWMSTSVSDGEYEMRAAVTVGDAIHFSSPAGFSVKNNVTAGGGSGSSTSTASSTNTSTINTSTPTTNTQTSSSTPSVSLRVGESSPVSGGVSLKALVYGAQKVRFDYRPSKTTSFSTLGYGTAQSDQYEWRYEWDSKKVVDGSYELRALATIAGLDYASNVFSLSVKNGQTATTTVIQTATTSTTTTVIKEVPPTVSFKIPEAPNVSGSADILITVAETSYIEIYALPKGKLTPNFLGLAQKQNTTDWKFVWLTEQTPNGEYTIYAKIKSTYGLFETPRQYVTVYNEPKTTYTTMQETEITDIKKVITELEDSVIVGTSVAPDPTNTETVRTEPMYITPVTVVLDDISESEDVENEIEKFIIRFKEMIDDDLVAFAKAIRSGDEGATQQVIDDLERIRKEAIDEVPVSKERTDIIAKIEQYLKTMIEEQRQLIERNERILRERLGDIVLKDSDKDGITDFDEINLYGTDPFSADTDKDGIVDDAEILGGFDPLDPKSESVMKYESPKVAGITRDELLTVADITPIALAPDEQNRDIVNTTALITGTGLPNSFVTLYIFSEPIVVTVKTDANGNWSYLFEKELSDGEHEVYAGFTDNTGRIVAKSSPLRFVKTAEAFSKVNAAGAPITVDENVEPSLMTERMLYALASLAVVGLGLVLILLGFYVSRRENILQATA